MANEYAGPYRSHMFRFTHAAPAPYDFPSWRAWFDSIGVKWEIRCSNGYNTLWREGEPSEADEKTLVAAGWNIMGRDRAVMLNASAIQRPDADLAAILPLEEYVAAVTGLSLEEIRLRRRLALGGNVDGLDRSS